MAEIKLLDSETINQIAAGEVVERPASVVKELVENAIDANATAITVEIKDGGISMIRITDNGEGIPEEQVPIAFSRHATSKIRTVEDLLCVSSLGFRGEALSSIAAVSRVELFSKTADALFGIHYRIEGGEEKELSEAGIPDGTTFVVRNLFYNTPARRKFLKSASAEGSQIQELMIRFALSHPEIAFKFIMQNQVKLQTGGRQRLQEIVYEVCGRETASRLMNVESREGEISVSGLIGEPVIGRGNRNFEYYFINGRYIKSKVLSNAIEDAYQGFLMQHRYPFVVLNITMPGSLMDVNVHPAKMELRFRDEKAVYHAVFSCISKRLHEKELISRAELTEEQEEQPEKVAPVSAEPFSEKPGEALDKDGTEREKAKSGSLPWEGEIPAGASTVREPSLAEKYRVPEPFEKKRLEAYTAKRQEELAGFLAEQKEQEQLQLFDDRLISSRAALKMKLVGQVFATYWIVEYGENMYIIDQHAAHEKVLYERMKKELSEREMTSQQVSPPIILSLTPEEEEKLRVYLPYFERLGYQIQSFGGMDYAVGAVPGNLYGLSEKETLLQILDELDLDTGRNNETVILEKLASMSCKAAVKGGMNLSEKEAEALFEELLLLENPYYCPHGRPVIIAMSRQDLEKKFKRIL